MHNNNISNYEKDLAESSILYKKHTQVDMHNTQNTISTLIIPTTITQNNYNDTIT